MRGHIYLALTVFLSLSLYGAYNTVSDVNDTSAKETSFFSDEDGMLDASEFLATQHGFLAAPIIITEPAVGYGAGLSVIFLHDSFSSSLAEKKSPPSVSGVAGLATENGTWMGTAFHFGYWREDTIRSTTMGAYINVNSNFYIRDFPIEMNINGYAAYQELMFRLGESNFFLGGNYAYANNQAKRTNESVIPSEKINERFEQEFKLGALAGIIQYDSRDSQFTPSEGLFAKASLRRFDEKLGGDQNFWNYGAKATYFLPLGGPFVLGVRIEGEAVHASDGDSVPFYSNPSIIMRGIPAMRYQGEKMTLAELQLRWEFINRWNLVAFGGGGKVFGQENVLVGSDILQSTVSFKDADIHPAGGLGFRYELARKFGMWGGMDFATSEEHNFAFYFVVGSAWGAF